MAAPAGVPSDPPSSRTRGWRRWALVALSITGTSIAVVANAPRLLDGDDYAHVASIEQTRSYRDPTRLNAAWQLPVAARYGRAGFEYQSNPSYCGPASVANVVRSLGVDASQHEVVRGTEHESWFGVLVGGLTLDELAALLRLRTARPVTIVRGASLARFREHVRASNDPTRRYVVNFHRGPLFGRGHGHFSPVLGYLEADDLVLVGDVNDEYRPFLVETARLWQATQTVDGATGQLRGLLIVDVR
jgi:hypothetical protein